jgi:rhamnosyltransferase
VVEFLPTSGTLISVEAWLQVGPFRSDYFIGGIDVEWGQRAWAHGFASVLVDDVTMVHRWGEINVDRNRPQVLRQSAVRVHYYVRNATHGMTLPHMSFRWKRWQAVRLVGQVFLLFLYRRDFSIGRLTGAVRDGWSGRLGPLPSEE